MSSTCRGRVCSVTEHSVESCMTVVLLLTFTFTPRLTSPSISPGLVPRVQPLPFPPLPTLHDALIPAAIVPSPIHFLPLLQRSCVDTPFLFMMNASTSLQHEAELFGLLTRVGGSLSLPLVCLVLVSYVFIPRVRTEPNTFLAFSSAGSILGCIACIVGSDGIRQGLSSPLCLAQGFLMDVSALSGPLWSLGIAVHLLVGLARGSKQVSLQKWGWAYCLICYGGPLALALTRLHIKRPRGATLNSNEGWCWESAGQEVLPVYIPVWGCIFTSLVIYLGVTVHISRKRYDNQQGWDGCNSVRSSRASGDPLVAASSVSSDSIISLSDWPLSPSSGNMFFGTQCTKAAGRSRPVTYPPPVHTSPVPPAGTWLRAFALSPRPAPTPPPRGRFSVKNMTRHFTIKDSTTGVHLWTGLMFAGSLLVTWLPGTIKLGWNLVHPELGSPLGFRVAVSTVLPLQGLWIAGIFFALNWNDVRRGMIRPPSRTTISGLLEEPLQRLRGNSVSSGGTNYDVEKAKRDLKVAIPWHRQTQRDDWDFVDIGIPSRENTIVRPRPNSEPVISPLLPSPALGRNHVLL
ncbi:uncharacterized protein B0H64DRAFT_412694 [Chaetomium fimeti]|uniref:G-protein coupled receptors family 2 profile 2 domain-containing protein n=1 Tax=Chaetomium fimeti TaxID=1854472 RepID=A0AAE0H5S7_9PEZI|nr:hypothetical protein B0H64DRAFT_412694 [Chaetomium fimeti]